MTLPPTANLRTSQRQRIRSLPPSHRSPHLERHLLSKEKERLTKEIALLERRCRYRRQHLADVEARIRLLTDPDRWAGACSCHAGWNSPPAQPDPRITRMTVEY